MTTLSKSYRLILCAALISGLALPALAEDRGGSSLGFEEARALALASSPELRQAEIALKTALNREGIAVSELFPSLEAGFSLRASARDILDGNLSPVLSLQANAQISSTGNRWFRLKSASLAVQNRAASMAGRRLAVLAAFENAWFAALRAQDSLESSRQKEESAARALSLAEKREAMGLVPRSTLLQARSRYASARSELIQSQSSSLVAHKALDALRVLAEATQADVHADLIFGLPGEDAASFAAGCDHLVRLGIGEIQVNRLKGLPGTPLLRLPALTGAFSPLPPYEVLRTDCLGFADLTRMQRLAHAWDRLHNRGHFSQMLPLLWRDAGRSPYAAVGELAEDVYRREGRVHALGREAWAAALKAALDRAGVVSAGEA